MNSKIIYQFAANTPNPSWHDVSKETHDEYASRGEWLTRAVIDAPVVERQPFTWMRIDVDGHPYCCRAEDHGDSFPVYRAPPELAELQATIAQLKAQLQPRTIKDLICLAYIAEMSPKQINDLLTKQHEEITMLRNVVKEVAEQFDGGPDHPWIPGFNAKKIYNKVMLASVPLRSAQSDEPSE